MKVISTKNKVKHHKNFGKTKTERVLVWVAFTIFLIHSISLILPLAWGFIASFKSGALEYFGSPFSFPQEWKFDNYIKAINVLETNDVGFVGMVFNSLWFAGGSALFSVAVTAVCAYVFARYEFPFKKFLFAFSVFLMIIPVYGALPAQYDFYGRLGIKNSPLILVTALGAFGTSNFLIMTSYFRNLAKDYKDAAMVDGANDFTAFFRVMLPQTTGMVLSFFMLQFMASWNDYYSPMIFLDKMPTLSSGLFTYQTITMRMGNYPIYFAGVFISCIPIVILYSCMHNVVVKNMSFGGLKG